jgi:hypothetical protein
MFNKLFAKKEKRELVITEGIAGYWHYHISYDDTRHVGLCGKRTMYSGTAVVTWNWVGHRGAGDINYSYCKDCEHLKNLASGKLK